MKKLITTYFLCVIFLGGFAQNNQNTPYIPLNSYTDLQNRTVETVLNGQAQGDIMVGKIPDNWIVTPSGAFSYSVPIRIPKGAKGVEPQLSIVYNSHAGNGLVGYNWNIGGLSAISRVSKSIHQNNEIKLVQMEAEDRFALDGSRLFPLTGINGMNGTVYGTESESFVRIVLHASHGNGPAWFEVELKNGTKMQYGNTPDSKDIAFGSSSTQSILTWKLNKVTDLNGNYLEYQYFWLNGQQVIQKIKYTGNAAEGLLPYNEVEFQYTKRNDTEHKFVTKFRKRQMLSNLLDKVIINNDGNHYKTYRFKYGYDSYSLLKNIVEEGANNSGQQFIPTEFTYNEFTHNLVETNAGTIPGDNEYRVGDFNGDGLSDLLKINRSFNSRNERQYDGYQILLNNNGTFVSHNYTFPTGRILQQSLNQDIYTNRGIGHFMLGDFNGDGKTDITYSSVKETNGKNNLYLTNVVIQFSDCINNSVGFTATNYGIPDGTYKFLGRRNTFIVGDFNGDGAQDLYLNLSDGHKKDYGIHDDNVYNDFILNPILSNSFRLVSNIEPGRRNELHQLGLRDLVHVIDMNGDGVSEIMQILENKFDNRTIVKQFDKNYTTHYVYWDYHGTAAYGNFPNKDHILKFGDFNGDGYIGYFQV
jgi:hypothetical protein